MLGDLPRCVRNTANLESKRKDSTERRGAFQNQQWLDSRNLVEKSLGVEGGGESPVRMARAVGLFIFLSDCLLEGGRGDKDMETTSK